MNNKFRHLKVVRSFKSPPRAQLSLSGRWLEYAGFRIGMSVRVMVLERCLIITLAQSMENNDQGNPEFRRPAVFRTRTVVVK